jgi:hypothetical protein
MCWIKLKQLKLDSLLCFIWSLKENELSISVVSCIFGRWPFCHLCRLTFLIILFVFLCLIRRFLVYIFSVLKSALRFQ